MEVKAGMRINLLKLQYIQQITKTLIHFSTLECFTNSMGPSQPSRLFSGGRMVIRKISGNSAYRSCFPEINKIKPSWGRKEDTFISLRKLCSPRREKKRCFPVPVPWKLRILCSYCLKNQTNMTALSSKESGWIALNNFSKPIAFRRKAEIPSCFWSGAEYFLGE